MANRKCKYCGGDVEQFPGNALGICADCGSTMTLPPSDDPKRIAAHNCGNYFRRTGNFAKALDVYQGILKEDPMDAEASWCSALCRFEILYEFDADFGAYKPVCSSTPAGDFRQDGDYLAALAHSDGAVQIQYEREATRIAQLFHTEDTPEEQEINTSLLLNQAYLLLGQQKWEEADGLCQRYLSIDSQNAMAHLGRLLAQVHCSRPKDLMNCTDPFDGSEHYQNALRYADPALKKSLHVCNTQIKKRNQLQKIDEVYQAACRLMENATTQEQYRKAEAMFTKLSGFRDSDKRAEECRRTSDTVKMDAMYMAAVAAANNAKTAADHRKALELFAKTPGWRDTEYRAEQCRQKMAEANVPKQPPKPKKPIAWKRTVGIMLAIVLLLTGSVYLLITKYIIPERHYKEADAMFTADDREGAIAGFQALGTYKDAAERALRIQQNWYAEAEARLSMSDFVRAAAAFGGLKDYADARERCLNIWDSIAVRPKLSAGGWYTAGVTINGTAEAVGDNREKQGEVDDWIQLTAISAGWSHTVGLKYNGTVVAAGYNGDQRGSVEDWKNIVAVSAGQWHTVGLQANGKVIGTGCSNHGRIDFDGWVDIADISAGRNHTLGLRADGTVAAVGDNRDGQCDTADWVNISAISAGGSHSVGLLLDGTAVATGSNEDGQCQVGGWTDLIAVAAGFYHTVGLKSDGTVVAVGLDEDGQCQVSTWKDIVAISAGGWHTVGLKSDGTVVTCGRNVHAQCETGDWQALMTR